MSICRDCPPQPCTLPDNLAFREPICSTKGYSITMPLGNIVFVEPEEIPCVSVPVGAPGTPITLQLMGCVGMITRTLEPCVNADGTPGTVTDAAIQAAVESMQAEWATQLASPECNPAPTPTQNPEQSETVGNSEQCATAVCPAGFTTEPAPVTVCVPANTMTREVFNPTAITIAQARSEMNQIALNTALQESAANITNCSLLPNPGIGKVCFFDHLVWTQNVLKFLPGYSIASFQYFGGDPIGEGLMYGSAPRIGCTDCAGGWAGGNRSTEIKFSTTIWNCNTTHTRHVRIRFEIAWNVVIGDPLGLDQVFLDFQGGPLKYFWRANDGAGNTVGSPSGSATWFSGTFNIAPLGSQNLFVRMLVQPCQSSDPILPCICGPGCPCFLLAAAASCRFFLEDL